MQLVLFTSLFVFAAARVAPPQARSVAWCGIARWRVSQCLPYKLSRRVVVIAKKLEQPILHQARSSLVPEAGLSNWGEVGSFNLHASKVV